MSEEKSEREDQETDQEDSKGASEDEVRRIETIDRTEALGYDGEARGEHSGQNEPVHSVSIEDELADNEPDETPREEE